MPILNASRVDLSLPAAVSESVRSAGEAAYPEEACGLLLGRRISGTELVEGRGGEGGDRRGTESGEFEPTADQILDAEVIITPNLVSGQRPRRYVIAPETVLLERRRARSRGLELVGFFHSHPDGDAEPSADDAGHAWADHVYLIVSVASSVAGRMRAWYWTPDQVQIEVRIEVPIEPPKGLGDRGALRPPRVVLDREIDKEPGA